MLLEDSYIPFIIEHKLTQAQFLLLYLIYKNRADLVRKYKQAFPSEDGTMIGEHYTQDLYRRGFLENKGNGKVVIGRKFLDAFINKHTATEEIFAVYPTIFYKDGIPISLSAMDRNVFANLYDIAISSSVNEHLEVLADIEYGLKHNLLNIGIEKFIKSKYWLTLRPKRKEGIIKDDTPTIKDNEF